MHYMYLVRHETAVMSSKNPLDIKHTENELTSEINDLSNTDGECREVARVS